MRVIAGSAKGFRLRAPEGDLSRPVLDRVKESWFASIAGRLADARVLDLYCGVGSLGIEALSRGARLCVFVDKDPECVRLLGEHLARTRLAGRATVRRCLAEQAAYDLGAAGDLFDLIFVDPPFAETARREFFVQDPAFTRLGGIAAKDALVMLRRDSFPSGPASDAPDRFSQACRNRRSRPYGAAGHNVAPAGRASKLCGPAPAGLVFARARRWGRNEVLFYERRDGEVATG